MAYNETEVEERLYSDQREKEAIEARLSQKLDERMRLKLDAIAGPVGMGDASVNQDNNKKQLDEVEEQIKNLHKELKKFDTASTPSAENK